MVNELALKPCPFCGALDHLSVQSVGSMAAGMPDRPYRVICTHIDHDTVVGPTAFGRFNAVTAWNTRAAEPAADVVDRLRAENEALTEALVRADEAISDVARLSNPDWTEMRVYPGDTLNAVHETTGRIIVEVLRRQRSPLAALQAQPADPGDLGDFVRIPVEAYEFLMGQGPLEGCHFGEQHPDRPGEFWWRAVIQEREAAHRSMLHPAHIPSWAGNTEPHQSAASAC